MLIHADPATTVSHTDLRCIAVEVVREMYRDLTYQASDLDNAPPETIAVALQSSAVVFNGLLNAAIESGCPVALPNVDYPCGARDWFLRKDAE